MIKYGTGAFLLFIMMYFLFIIIVIKVQNMFDKEKYPKALRFSIMIEGLFCRTTDE
ncbi:hypothetical protein IGL28_001011 [Enterococcus sp. AZ077]